MTTTINDLVGNYVAIRDKLKAMEEEFDAKKKPVKETLDKIGGILREHMEKTGSEGIRTEAGTCYLTTRYTSSLADSEMFFKYVIDSERYDLLDKKANTTAVREFVKQNGGLPPGCNLSAIQTVGVKRGSEKP